MEEKQSNDQTAGEVHSWMDQFHVNMIKTIISHFRVQYLLQEKFLTPQLEIVSTDPGKFLAWLVLLSSVLTFILGHVVYLAMFLLIYITWAYSEHIQENDASDKDGDENEWLLDKFFCFLQQLDNGKNILSSYCINNFIADVDLPNHIVMVQSVYDIHLQILILFHF